MKKTIAVLLVLLSFAALWAQPSSDKDEALTVYAYDSFSGDWGPAAALIPDFEAKTGIKVNLVGAGDAVEMLSRVILEGDRTDADVILGISDDFAYKAYPYLESYDSPMLSDIDDSIEFDAESRLLPYDYGYFAFVWDSESGIRKPESLSELTLPEYKDKVILIDPRTSSVGLGLLFWTYNLYGDSFTDWWIGMKDNALTITDGWSSAYGLFTEGEAPIVLSYTTSPVYHVMNEGTTRYQALIFPEGHEATIEGLGIRKGTEKRAEAERFIDYILSDGQLDTAVANSMYPASSAIDLPDAYDWAPEPPVMFTATELSEELKNELLERWTEAMTK